MSDAHEDPADDDGATAEMRALYASRGIDVASLVPRSDGTLGAAERLLTVDSATLVAASGATGASTAPGVTATEEPLRILGELGRGGMGQVHLAEQRVLRRQVAVKRGLETPSALEALLKEAWVGASLEHPGVVPVHVLASLEGRPAVVMKRIEGQAWSRFLRDPSLVPARAQSDPFAWHARILAQVCHAVARAHEAGVLHLDLKPDNVMIGSFGEVYVLDWGLAAGWGPSAPPWLGRAEDVRSVAGTPEYMAPELAVGAGDRLSPRTDVYLLGAILHEIVTGEPPHVAPHVLAKLYRASRSEPAAYPATVPAELAELLHRALHREPGERFESADAFREAVEAFLVHRAADELVREARTQLTALAAEVGKSARDEGEIWHGFGASRFALREARESRADHPDLPALEVELHRTMARWAIQERRVDLARAHLDALVPRDAGLEAELAAIRDDETALAARVRELEAIARSEDLSIGSALRERIAVALGFLFLAINLGMAVARDRGVTWGYQELVLVNAATFCVLAPYGVWKRHEIFRNRANSVFFAVCIATWVVVQGYWAAGAQLGVTAEQALTMTPVFYLLAFGTMTVLVSMRFWVSAVLQIPTIVAAARWPEHAYEIIGVGGGASAALVGVAWKPTRTGTVAPADGGAS